MIKCIVNKKKGETTSIIPHSNGTYPVWFKGYDIPKFIDSSKVKFIKKR